MSNKSWHWRVYNNNDKNKKPSFLLQVKGNLPKQPPPPSLRYDDNNVARRKKSWHEKTTNIVNPTHLLAKKTSTDVTIIIFNCRNSSRRNNRTITTITLSSSWAIHRHTLSTLTRLWYRIFLLIPNIYVSHIGTALSLKTRAFTEYTAVHSLPFG